MDLCTLPTEWPYYKVQILIFLFFVGCAALYFTIAFIRKYKKEESLIFQGGRFWRLMFRLHKTQFAKTLTFSAAALPVLMIVKQLSDSDRCDFWYTIIFPSEACACFLAFYILWSLCGEQGLPSFLGPNLKITWDRGDIMSLHLGGEPEEIVSLLNNDFPGEIDRIATNLEQKGLPTTLRLESWLFFRPGDEVMEAELVELRKAIDFPKIKGYIIKVSGRPPGFVNKWKRRLAHTVIFILLVARANKILWHLNRLDTPKKLLKDGDSMDMGATGSIQLLIRKLRQLDTSRRFINLPFRRMRVFEVINLICHYPSLANTFYPWSTGFQLSK